jgi:hypothetical protein
VDGDTGRDRLFTRHNREDREKRTNRLTSCAPTRSGLLERFPPGLNRLGFPMP